MKRLSGLDATFLYSETPSVFMHTLKVAVLNVPAPEVATFERFRDVLGGLLDRMPAFRQRALGVPLGLHHPVWVEDPDFDLDNHLFHRRLTPPGTRRQLDDAIGEIAGRPLLRKHPLWAIWMIDGLSDGRVAFVAKIHHAVADGKASAELLASVMSAAPDASVTAKAPVPDRRSPLPSRARLLWSALADQPRRLRRLPPLVAKTVRGFRDLIETSRAQSAVWTRPFATTKTVFNRALSGERAFASTSLDMEPLRQIRLRLGVSLNDVLLAVVGEAVRRYLKGAGHDTARSLSATVPIGLAAAQDCYQRGNRLSNMFTSLHTDEVDPVKRVLAIHAASRASKAALSTLGDELMHAWAEYTPAVPYEIGFKLYSRLRLADHHRPAANLIVSNVRGPAHRLFVAGAELCELFSVGPILDGLGLNVTAWSYSGQVGVAALTDRAAVPDAHAITDRMHDSLVELAGAAAAHTIETARPSGETPSEVGVQR